MSSRDHSGSVSEDVRKRTCVVQLSQQSGPMTTFPVGLPRSVDHCGAPTDGASENADRRPSNPGSALRGEVDSTKSLVVWGNAVNLLGPEVLIVLVLVGLVVWLLFFRPRRQLKSDQSAGGRVDRIIKPVILDPVEPAQPTDQATTPLSAPGGRAGYRRSDNTFHGPLNVVVQYATLAIHDLGWTVMGASEMTQTITFETRMSMGSWSGVTCTLSFFQVAPNVWRVTGSGKQNVRGAQLVAIDLGRAEATANRAIIKMIALAPPLD